MLGERVEQRTLGHGSACLLPFEFRRFLHCRAGDPHASRENRAAGTIGDTNMTIENDYGSTINAMVEGSSKTLTLDATAYNAATNTTFINNGGTVEASSGATLNIDSAMYNSQYLIANAGGTVVAGEAVFGPGLSIIRGNGSMEFLAEADNDVRFAQGSGGQLILDDFAQFFGNIYQMTVGDLVDLRDFSFNSANPSAMKVGGDSGSGILDAALQITNGVSLSSNLYLRAITRRPHGPSSRMATAARRLHWRQIRD